MAVYVQGRRDCRVTKSLLYHFRVDVGLQQGGGVCVPQGLERRTAKVQVLAGPGERL